VSSGALNHSRRRAAQLQPLLAAACAVAVAVAAVVLLAAGCSSGSSSSAGSGGGGGSGSGIRVTATETEWHIALSRTSFSPGTYTFVAVDKGHSSHNLNVVGPGVNSNIGVLLSPGGSASVTVTLRKGTYDIFCSVPGHQAKGMDVRIKVS